MKAIIICDDALSLEKVINAIETINNVTVAKIFAQLNDVDSFVSVNEVDVVFVDITSSKKEKIDLIKKLRNLEKRVFTILISDSKEDSLLAYSLHAAGFLLKSSISVETINEEILNIKYIDPKLFLPVTIKTFGNFSVFNNGKPVHFSIKKSREILAYLVYKQGTQVDWPTLAAEVFDEDLYDSRTYHKIHKAVFSLKKDLDSEGIGSIICCTKGHLSINENDITCDLYMFLNGDQKTINSYFGEFMYEYDWAKERTAFLDNVVNNLKK